MSGDKVSGQSVKSAAVPTDVHHPFDLPWLDSCYQQTLLPNGPWEEKVVKKLCDNIASKLDKQLDVEQRRQIIFEMLGQEFVHKYFPKSSFNPYILEPPYLTAGERRKLESDAGNWLQHIVSRAASETGCQRQITSEASGTVPNEDMLEFLRQSARLFEIGLDRHLSGLEQQVHKAVETTQWKERKSKEFKMESMAARGYTAGGAWGSVKLGRSSRGSLKSDGQTKAREGARSDRSAEMFWGHQSNCIGKSVVAVLRRDPRRFAQVASRMHGRQLCGTLRSYMWMDVLLKDERSKLNDINLEKVIRERFAKAVSRGLVELNIKRAAQSPISSVVDKAVSEIYTTTPGMRLFIKKDPHMKEAAKALNVLYVYDRTYEPYLVYWLFPLQLAFERGSGESEHCYELAMYLDLLNKSCFPKWPEIFAIAEVVLMRVSTVDPVLHQHLRTIACINPAVNTKEFLVHLIHQEKTKAEQLMSSAGSPSASTDTPLSKDLLADPLMFLRKWVGEGFVGVLDTPAVVFVWDQCFMQRWKTSVLEDFCLAILLLLRDKFMAARDYVSMRQVFLSEASKLYTVDIQQSWVHLQKKGSPADIPAMNRLTELGKHQLSESRATSRQSRPQSDIRAGYLTSPRGGTEGPDNSIVPVGIKNISAQLVIQADTLRNEKWMQNLSVARVQLACTVYFGSVQLETKTSVLPPVAKSVTEDADGSQIYSIGFEMATFEFSSVDLSQYDLEQEMGGYPYVILQLNYVKEEQGQDIVLGWTKVQLYQYIAATSQWQVLAGEKSCPLTSGSHTDTDRTLQAHIGPGSQLQLVVFDRR